ncbi:hypothetical protein PPTG_23099 [Phytophthora nicotianae INRA-310]|uniref:Uncharacterized protein n=1 Tax=Phytophthora nicotianae (strain INRA-310) TaxID=761204 RepID=W2Q6L6_PHYN3|nr:hypothetical protein PPTG_23099 [Phytophthora nicotianae INRA-310]ETN07895.1 hypothetical protein PPTG_23099 [Phytophthora nicotianae INRA-310]
MSAFGCWSSREFTRVNVLLAITQRAVHDDTTSTTWSTEETPTNLMVKVTVLLMLFRCKTDLNNSTKNDDGVLLLLTHGMSLSQ